MMMVEEECSSVPQTGSPDRMSGRRGFRSAVLAGPRAYSPVQTRSMRRAAAAQSVNAGPPPSLRQLASRGPIKLPKSIPFVGQCSPATSRMIQPPAAQPDQCQKFDPRLFGAYDSRYGPFQVHASCQEDGRDRLLDLRWSVQRSLATSWAGRSIFSCPKEEHIEPVLCKYLDSFAAQPSDTRAMFLLPEDRHSSWWWRIVQDSRFRCMAFYPAGSRLFVTVGGGKETAEPTSKGYAIFLHSERPPETLAFLHPSTHCWPPVCPPTIPANAVIPTAESPVQEQDLYTSLQVGEHIPGLQELLQQYQGVFAAKAGIRPWLLRLV